MRNLILITLIVCFPIPAILLALLYAANLALRARPAQLHRVVDGDSIEVIASGQIERIRLRSIDAPEYHSQPHGKDARAALARLLDSGQLRLVRHGRDRYGRTLASAFVGAKPVSWHMVAGGHAWPINSLALVAFSARLQRRGLWADRSPIHPNLWRRASRISQL